MQYVSSNHGLTVLQPRANVFNANIIDDIIIALPLVLLIILSSIHSILILSLIIGLLIGLSILLGR